MDVSEENEMNELLKEARTALSNLVALKCIADAPENTGEFHAAMSAIDRLTAALSSVEAKPVAMTNERIDNIAGLVIKGMPDGLQGFMNVWGWQQFARALLECASVPDSIAAPLASVDAQSRLSEAQQPAARRWARKGAQTSAPVKTEAPQCPQPQAEPSPEVERGLLDEAEELLKTAEWAMCKMRLKGRGSDCRLSHEERMFALDFSPEGRDGPGALQVRGSGKYHAWRKKLRALSSGGAQ
jgi:hypothetical protein